MQNRIAALITCYNRYKKTVTCLEGLLTQQLPADTSMDVYLLDDNSPDKTAEKINTQFPQVKILHGNGSFFWAGGMRACWMEARKNNYDGYLLINDDVELLPGFINMLFEADVYSKQILGKQGLYVGSTYDPGTKKVSYGGRVLLSKLSGKSALMEPDKINFTKCDFAHANILLVMRNVVESIGVLSEKYTQKLADYDYTLHANKAGFPVVVCPGYWGMCEDDHGQNWLSTKYPLKERIRYLKSPKYLAYDEYLYFIKTHYPFYTPIAFIKLWMKTFFPGLWEKFKSKN